MDVQTRIRRPEWTKVHDGITSPMPRPTASTDGMAMEPEKNGSQIYVIFDKAATGSARYWGYSNATSLWAVIGNATLSYATVEADLLTIVGYDRIYVQVMSLSAYPVGGAEVWVGEGY